MWKLDQALDLVREIQPVIHGMGYHVVLGGGVLNNGESKKDLDLYFHPMMGKETFISATNPGNPLLRWLEELFGKPEEFWNPDQEVDEYGDIQYPHRDPYVWKKKYQWGNRRIDVFIVG